MKNTWIIGIISMMPIWILSVSAQSLPPVSPPPSPPIQAYGPGWGANGFGPDIPMWGTSPGMMTGGRWGPGAFTGPLNKHRLNLNNGISHVIGVGYDVQGVWETVPLVAKWHWNGVNYEVIVITAWNPWTRSWDGNLNMPAYQTQYRLKGITYDYYVNLSTGTYYFNSTFASES